MRVQRTQREPRGGPLIKPEVLIADDQEPPLASRSGNVRELQAEVDAFRQLYTTLAPARCARLRGAVGPLPCRAYPGTQPIRGRNCPDF